MALLAITNIGIINTSRIVNTTETKKIKKTNKENTVGISKQNMLTEFAASASLENI